MATVTIWPYKINIKLNIYTVITKSKTANKTYINLVVTYTVKPDDQYVKTIIVHLYIIFYNTQ